jgi:hypothetical protein
MNTPTYPTCSRSLRRAHAPQQPHSRPHPPLTPQHASVIVISPITEPLNSRHDGYAGPQFIAHPQHPPFPPPAYAYNPQSSAR